jgi:hypothetical protein
MAKYKIIPSSRTIVQPPISIGHKAEKGVEAIEFDLTAWVETYGSGTLTVIMRRWGDAIPYPIALEIGEDNKATWVLSDTDTARAGMAYAQLSYIVGETVVKKSDIYTFRVMDSLTGEGDPPEAYESWLEHLTHLAAEAMAEVLDIEGIVTDKTLTVDGGIADAKAAGDALALKADKSTTYTKTEVDTLIESVDVETDTTLSVSGKPADSAETGRQIGLLKADLGAFQIEGEITDYTISQGTISSTYGYDSDSNTRCRTSWIEFSGAKLVITPKEGYKVGGRTYNRKSTAESAFDGGQAFTTDSIVYTDSTKYYRLLIAKTDDSNVTPSTLPDDVVTVTYYDSTDKSLSIDGKSADAGAVGAMKTVVDVQIDTLAQKIGFTAEKHVGKWTSGTINANTGVPSDGSKSNRSYTNKLYFDNTVDNKVTVDTSESYQVSLREYRISDNGFVGSGSATQHAEITIDPTHYYRFVLSKTDDSDFAEKNVLYTDVVFTFKTANEQLDLIKRNNKIETIALLQQLNRKTRTGQSSYGNAPLCFIHFSDVHGDSACLANVVRFKDEYSDYISDILHTGDSVNYSATDGMGFWNCIDGSEYILNTIGNHDTNAKVGSSYVWTSLSMADSYSAYMAPYISNWDCTYTADKTYYYKDYTAEGVRLIVLDIMHQTAEQLSWFESTLASAKTASLDVIVAVHSRAHWLLDTHETVWDDKDNSPSYSAGYSDTSSYTGSNYPSNLADDYASAVDDFIDDGGYFICWLHGHTHFRILADLQTHPNQLDVAVANAGGEDFAPTYVWARVPDTKSMDDFNVVGIDTTGKILRIAKIGVNTDRLMRVAHTLSYNYQTHTIINAN